jgi:hypothetical protein
VLPLRLSVLFIRFLGCCLESLGGPFFGVLLGQVAAHEVFPTMLTEVDPERVVAVPFELTPLLELGVGTESALDLANRTASRCPVGLCRYE